jgi:hypothetical protein
MAMSALRSSWASSRVSRSSKAMPMLARMVTCPPTRGKGAPRVARTRWASSRAVSRSVSSARMANSSPPSRPTVSCSRRQLRSRPDLAQQPVPGAVAEAVVDHLEVVQVDEEHGHAAAVAARPGQRVPDPVVEQRPVGQVGEAVVERQVLELGRQGVALAQRGPQHALGAAQLAHGGLVLADQVGHPDQHQQEQQGAAGHDHRDVQALVAQRLDGQDGRGHQRRPGQREQPGPGQPGPRGRDRSVRVATEGSSTAAPHRA